MSDIASDDNSSKSLEMTDIEKASEDDKFVRGSPSTEEMDTSEKCCSVFIMVISFILILCTFPFSLCVCLKMVQVICKSCLFYACNGD